MLEAEKVNASIVRVRSVEGDQNRYVINAGMSPQADRNELFQRIKQIEGLTEVKFDSRDTDEQL
jgi:sRNA-binding carbon storage regulator CsrA